MKKTRGFLLTAGIALATAFTFSCSDDKDDPSPKYGPGACYYADPIQLPGIEVCMKFTSNITAATCESHGTVFQNDCPPNYKKECHEEGQVSYYYGEVPANICDH